ncbi:major facilitator superfamily domain-containing protein [Dipodascopsis tothii]|uniref:major facilitator superfamily domain-containing protein n=1 Tax=Dipodascopsis tothii TaxID=44089 RepID=UPI0034CD43F9
MGLGVLEDKHLTHVPGTSKIEDALTGGIITTDDIDVADRHRFKRGTGKYSHIILVPQPSDDPNDPLNWTPLKKHTVFASLMLALGVLCASSPVLSPGYGTLMVELDKSLLQIMMTSGASLITSAAFAPFVTAFALKFGKRPMFLFAVFIAGMGMVGSALSKNYTSLIATRVIQGIGCAPMEATIFSIVNDMYFVHERGVPSVVIQFVVAFSLDGVGIVSGPCITNLGWQWAFWILSILTLSVVVLGLFTFHETLFVRDVISPEFASEDDLKDVSVSDAEKQSQFKPAKGLFCKPWELVDSGYTSVSKAGFWVTVLRTFPMYMSPMTWFAILTFGMLQVFIVISSSSIAAVLMSPPYYFNATDTGLTSVASLVGALLALVLFGPILDWCVRFFSARNGGVFEPEFRLPPMFLATLFVCFGFVGYGYSTNHGIHWMAPTTCLGMLAFGQTIGCSTTMAYIADSFCDRSAEAWAAISIVRNIISFSFLWFISDWLAAENNQQVFGILAGLAVACTATTIPMYIYGKRVRSWCYRHGFVTFNNQLVTKTESKTSASLDEKASE